MDTSIPYKDKFKPVVANKNELLQNNIKLFQTVMDKLMVELATDDKPL